MLSLGRLGAFSLKKGCYPGQEIVSRTHYLGQAKRVLFLLRADGPVQEGDAVRDDSGRELGRIVCSAGDGQAQQVLAVLPADLDPDARMSAGANLTPQPLLDGLSR